MRWLLLLSLLALTACSTVGSRIKENPAAFSSLSPKQQALVQNAQIAEGMNRDAVYIAWGRPDGIVTGSDHGKRFDEWLYESTYVDYVNYYGPYPYFYGRRYWTWGYYFYNPTVIYSVPYVYKSVRFENGRVAGWRRMPRS